MPRHPSAPPRLFWHGQRLHLVLLVALLGGAWLAVDVDAPDTGARTRWAATEGRPYTVLA